MFEEVFKTKIDYKHKDFTNFSSSGNTVFLFLTILLFYNIIFTISKQENKIKAIMIFILIVFLVLFYINNKYETNINFSKKYKHVDELINEVNSGDIVLFRTYLLTEFGNFINFLTPFFQNTYFTHIGMIFKDKNGKAYIMESNGETFFCDIFKREKKGVCFLDLAKRIKNSTYHRIHIVKNNIHKYLDHDKFEECCFKYKDYDFNENGVYCLNLVTKILNENDIMKPNFILPYIFEDVINPKNYNKNIIFEEPIIIKEYIEEENKI